MCLFHSENIVFYGDSRLVESPNISVRIFLVVTLTDHNGELSVVVLVKSKVK